MNGSTPQPRSSGKWLWIVILLALLALVIAWFADPLGKIAGSPKAEPSASPTEWTTAPPTPGVEVNLPQTPMTNSAPQPSGRAPD